jgi:hypothetical protein
MWCKLPIITDKIILLLISSLANNSHKSAKNYFLGTEILWMIEKLLYGKYCCENALLLYLFDGI